LGEVLAIVGLLNIDPEVRGSKELEGLLRLYRAEEMTAYPVDTLVNSPKNDVPQCLRQAG